MQTGRQLLLFEDEYILFNGAVRDLQNLNLEAAESGFLEYGNLYKKSESVDGMLQLIGFLKSELAKCAAAGLEEPARLCRSWADCEEQAQKLGVVDERLMEGIKKSFFLMIERKIEEKKLNAVPFLDNKTPTGYVYLQTERFDQAVNSLQACLPLLPDTESARIYGYLGDAYVLLGDTTYARKYYLEALLQNPLALDWRHFKDAALLELKRNIQDDLEIDHAGAAYWLPSIAYVKGMFQPKLIRQLDIIKALVAEYIPLAQDDSTPPPEGRDARIFIRAIILCDNEPFLKMVKGIDFADIRRRMKEIDAPLFADYMKLIKTRGKGV